MKGRIVVLLILLLGVSLTTAQDQREETIVLTFIPNIQYAPFYVALAEGYFAEAGLDITYEYNFDEAIIVDQVAAGDAPFGLVSGEQVILARSRQRPVTFIYAWYQEYPIGVTFPTGSGIESINDLAGRAVGIPGRFGASYIALTALLRGSGMTEADINLMEIGFNAPEVMCVGVVEAAVVYFNNEPLQIRSRAEQGDCGSIEDVGIIPVSTVADLVSNGLVTNEMTLNDDPELIQAVVTAFDRAVQDVMDNPARAYLLSLDYVEGLPATDDLRAALAALAAEQEALLATDPDAAAIAASREAMLATLRTSFDSDTLLQFAVLIETIPLWEAEPTGYSEAESWATMQATLLDMGLMDDPVDLDAVFTNEFVAEAG